MAEYDEEKQVPEKRSRPDNGQGESAAESAGSSAGEISSRSLPEETDIQEYRLVPLEASGYYDEDEKIVDFVGVARDLWDHRSLLVKILTLFLLLGAFLYLFGERTYYAETSLMPERQNASQVDRLLQQYQGVLGLNLPSGAEGEELDVTLYPKIVESLPFQLELIQQEVYFQEYDREMTLFEYFRDVRDPSVAQKTGNLLWSVTFGLPGTLRGFLRSEEEEPAAIDFSRYSSFEIPQVIDSDIRSVISDLEKWITIRIEPQTSFLVVGVSMPDSHAAAETVNIVKEQLQRYVTEYRTEKATQDMLFIEEQYDQAQIRFEEVQDSLARFQDQNIMLSSAQSRVMEERLQSRYTLAFDLYNSLGTRLEEARIKVQEETPVFRTHEPVTIPTSPSAPRMIRIFAGAVFLGLFTGIVWIYAVRGARNFFTAFRNRPSAR